MQRLDRVDFSKILQFTSQTDEDKYKGNLGRK